MDPGPHTVALLRAIGEPRTEAQRTSVVNLATRISDWEELIAMALTHGVVPLLFLVLTESGAEIPPQTLSKLRHEYERNAFQCMANAVELNQVLQQFERAKINAMPFKGVVLAASAYGDLKARSAGDVDLLVDERDLQRASQILEDRGYVLTTELRADGTPAPDHYYELHFERPSDGMVVELRWRLELTQPRFTRVLGLEWVWPRRKNVEVAGFSVPGLDATSHLLVLCMHGSKHMWSRLMWVCDVAKVLETEPQLDWDALEREAKRTGLMRPLGLGIMLANRILGATVPGEALRRFERVASMRRLAEFYSEHLIPEPGLRPPGRVPYNIQLLGFGDRTRTVLSAGFLRPNAQDRAFVKLPRSLDALYYVIRPVRLLLDRSRR